MSPVKTLHVLLVGAMEPSDTRQPSEEEKSSHGEKEACSSAPSSLDMDCSEPYPEYTEGSGTQEMASVYGSLESEMDCSESLDEEEEENKKDKENPNEDKENYKEDNENHKEDNNNETSSTYSRSNSLTLKVSSVIVETETTSGSQSQDLSLNNESLSQDISLTIETKSDTITAITINASVSQTNSVNSSAARKRKMSDDEDHGTMNKRREDSEIIQ
ncbi:uncharacterized protein RB166_004339 [Leptodactylus fuscus]|uniref:uncharacterized protein LOC142198466 n=1 Tax=Leptodactylus fuscus TaxID=238119 RepID=UPI003F4E7F15